MCVGLVVFFITVHSCAARTANSKLSVPKHAKTTPVCWAWKSPPAFSLWCTVRHHGIQQPACEPQFLAGPNKDGIQHLSKATGSNSTGKTDSHLSK